MHSIAWKDKLKYFNIQNILCLYVVLCPVLDIISFLYRQKFNSSMSPSTLLRPLIPIGCIIYIFFKSKVKLKLKLIATFFIYFVYSLIHLFVFEKVKVGISYSNITHEAQYLINYSFMILILFIFIYALRTSNKQEEFANKTKRSLLISSAIYISSIFIAILTKTSSFTYIEKMGYKGWFESGNSIGAILILSMFVLLTLLKDKKYKYHSIIIIGLFGIYLTMLIGTRVGLFGFIIVLVGYICLEIIFSIFNKSSVSKRRLIYSFSIILAIVVLVGVMGSTTIQRRKYLKEIQSDIIDETTMQESHISGDLLDLKQEIDLGNIDESYMSKPMQQSVVELYNFANKYNISNSDMRMQQLIFNAFLVKNQRNVFLMLFGNGYVAQFRELILEMEIPAFLFNFGIIGFILYFIPFTSIFVYCFCKGMKNIKKTDVEYFMLLGGSLFVFLLSFFSGYTFFNSSTMTIIIVINTLLINKVRFVKDNINLS